MTLVIMLLAISTVQAATPSQDQLRYFQNLTPAQQRALLESTGSGANTQRQQPLSQPQVVRPNRNNRYYDRRGRYDDRYRRDQRSRSDRYYSRSDRYRSRSDRSRQESRYYSSRYDRYQQGRQPEATGSRSDYLRRYDDATSQRKTYRDQEDARYYDDRRRTDDRQYQQSPRDTGLDRATDTSYSSKQQATLSGESVLDSSKPSMPGDEPFLDEVLPPFYDEEFYLEPELTPQELSMQGDLVRFGYELFSGTPTTFAPATDIPVPVNYVVGPGDAVEVQLFGKDNQQYSLVVSREGVLNFPDIGPVTVAGMTFANMKQTLQQRIQEQMIGVKASISMGALRSIRVFVLGDAEYPGSYTVSSLTTITNALFVSGGIKPIGSLRNIQLKRNGRVVSRLDLYDLLLNGNTRRDVRLLPGDVIFIPPVGKTVAVAGEVRRPAIYELKDEKTVGEVLELAGGMLPTAYPRATKLERINSKRERTILDVDLSEKAGEKVALKSGDTLKVYSVMDTLEDIVLVTGNIEREGGKEWYQGIRLTDVIPSVKYLLPKSDLNYILVRREDPATKRISVVSADLEKALRDPASADNIELKPRDEVIVFGIDEDRTYRVWDILDELEMQSTSDHPLQEVSIGGRVHSPGEYPLEEDMRVSDLIRAAGKLQESAYVLDAEITRYRTVDGKYRQAEHINVDLAGILAGNEMADIKLKSHDHLIIKDVPRWAESEKIEIRGEVKFPGVYAVRRGETLSSVIRRAGGVTDLAFVDGAIFMREELRRREQEQMNTLARRLEADIAAASLESTKSKEGAQAGQQAIAVGKSLVEQLRSTKAAGRLVINLRTILDNKVDTLEQKDDGEYVEMDSSSLLVKDGDILVVPKKTQSVTVLGEVQYPTSHIYNETLVRDEYINRSGGMTNKADDKRVYVVRANGEVITGNDSFWSFDDSSTEIKPGDTVIVPLDAERIKPLTLWTNVTQIIYHVGIAVAAFTSAGIF